MVVWSIECKIKCLWRPLRLSSRLKSCALCLSQMTSGDEAEVGIWLALLINEVCFWVVLAFCQWPQANDPFLFLSTCTVFVYKNECSPKKCPKKDLVLDANPDSLLFWMSVNSRLTKYLNIVSGRFLLLKDLASTQKNITWENVQNLLIYDFLEWNGPLTKRIF